MLATVRSPFSPGPPTVTPAPLATSSIQVRHKPQAEDCSGRTRSLSWPASSDGQGRWRAVSDRARVRTAPAGAVSCQDRRELLRTTALGWSLSVTLRWLQVRELRLAWIGRTRDSEASLKAATSCMHTATTQRAMRLGVQKPACPLPVRLCWKIQYIRATCTLMQVY